MYQGAEHQKLAVNSGVWPLYHYNSRRVTEGLPPLVLGAPTDRASSADYMRSEARFRVVEQNDPVRFHELAQAATDYSERRVALFRELARIVLPKGHSATYRKQ